jgi:dTDP-glucose 4,6-dehydratase
MSKSFVVTGCMGLIGGYFTRLALSRGYKVYGIDKITYASYMGWLNEFCGNKNFTHVKEDISTLTYLPDCDFVVNFAAESHVDNSITNSDQFFISNVMGTKRLLDLVKDKRNYKMPTFIQLSTDETYGDNLTDQFHVETDVLKPSNPYAASKVGAEMAVVSYGRTFEVPYAIVRPTNNYGENQHPEKLIPKSIQLLQRGEKIQLHGDGSFVRCWLHAEDTAEAVLVIIEQGKTGVFNISGDEFYSIKDVAKIILMSYCLNEGWTGIKQYENIEDFIEYNFYRKGADVVYKIDDSKLRIETGWSPKRKFKEEIHKIVASQIFRW